MKILVTGASGAIGRHLVKRLHAVNHEVIGTINPESDISIVPQCSNICVDIRDYESVYKAFKAFRPEAVIHLASYGQNANHDPYPSKIIETNIKGSENVLKALEDYPAEIVINTGSSAEYGKHSTCTTEESECLPLTFYAFSKFHQTKMFTEAGHTTLRLYSVYMPGDVDNKLIPRLVEYAKCNELPPLSNPSNAHDYVYIDDVTDAYLAVLNKHVTGEVINICGGMHTLSEVVDTAKFVFGVTAEPSWYAFPIRKDDTSCWYGSNLKASELLNWKPKVNLMDGLKKIWNIENPSNKTNGNFGIYQG